MNLNHKLKYLLGALLILIAIFCWCRSGSLPTDSSKWQAVFLTNDQVYFGKLEDHNKKYAILKNVYYLKLSDELQQKNLNLIKLGGEAHGPEGEMFISKSQILFIENLKQDSTVVKAIEGNA